MKRTVCFVLILCFTLLLSACGGTETPAERYPSAGTETEAPAPTEEPSPVSDPPESPAVTEQPQPESEPPSPAAPEAVEVQVRYGETTEIEHVEFSGVSADGQELWKRIFTTDYRTELSLIQPIGAWKDRYYLNNNGTVVCLALSDGALLWENDGFGGASISGLIDERNGNVYLCGFYGPDFFACDREGKTLASFPAVSNDYFWPYGMRWAGPDRLVIYYTGGMDAYADPGVPYYIDLTDFSATLETNSMELSGDRQYWANIFISDFVEQFISEYPADGGSDAELSAFARLFCKLNRRDAIVYENGEETVGLDTVNELCMRFFGRELDPSEGAQYRNGWGMEWRFENGKFRFPAADGEAYNRFAVVTSSQSQTGGTVILSFDLYEVPLEEYWSRGIDGAFYRMTSAEARATADTGRITLVGSGYAEALPIEQSGHDGYHLYRLHVDRY